VNQYPSLFISQKSIISYHAIIPPCARTRQNREEVRAVICAAITEREAFVREQGMRAVGPLMGVVMKELRGRADGKVISELLKEEVGRIV
jgi:Glu-tRNA(Gln) amidotransferase subunit E-like FAD-binding protein